MKRLVAHKKASLVLERHLQQKQLFTKTCREQLLKEIFKMSSNGLLKAVALFVIK
jgi:hypothetical protein